MPAITQSKKSKKIDLFNLYWNQMKSRIVVGKKLNLGQRELFSDFGGYRIPMRAEPIIYEHEFNKLHGDIYNAAADSNSSDPFYCPAFKSVNLCTKFSVTGTLIRAFLRIQINLYTFVQDKNYLVKTGASGFLAITSAAMSSTTMAIQQAFTIPILAPFMDVEIVAFDPEGDELDSDNHFICDNVVGFFG